jgi:hypothetical protein
MRHGEDLPAWHYEKSGTFSVRSAYKLVFDLSRNTHLNSGNSVTGDNSRYLWKLIWRSNIPNNIRIFAWRCASDNLATRKNKWRRTLEHDSTCTICGTGEEGSFHATVACMKAKALRDKMREVWSLPHEDMFRLTGPDWLLILLSNSPPETHPKILLLLWRSWHLRNNIVHDDGLGSIEASSVFLQNYVNTLNCNDTSLDTGKGKQVWDTTAETPNTSQVCHTLDPKDHWVAPNQGMLKLNTDASFFQRNWSGYDGWSCEKFGWFSYLLHGRLTTKL